MPVLAALLKFVAAVDDVQQLPPGSYLTVTFLNEEDVTATMPLASTCTITLSLPVVHETYLDFKSVFVKALEYGFAGFGLM